MKLPPDNLLIPPRGASLRGLAYTRVQNGKLVWCAWPSPAQRNRSTAEEHNRWLFGWMSTAANYQPPDAQVFSRAVADRTVLAARDIMIAAMYGRFGHILRSDGRKLYPMPAIQDVSSLLDAIGQTPGDLLVRGPSLWQRVPLGVPAQVLTVQPDGSLAWNTPTSGAGLPPFMQVPAIQPAFASANFAQNNYAASIILPQQNVTVTGVRIFVKAPGATTTGLPAIYTANPSGLNLAGGALVAQGSPVTLAAGIVDMPFAAPVNLAAGTWYYFGPCIRGTGGTTLARLDHAGDAAVFAQSGATMPSTAPANSNTQQTYAGWWLY